MCNVVLKIYSYLQEGYDVLRWFKRFLGFIPALEKEQCPAKLALEDTTFYCVKNQAHIGPHKTNQGKSFWMQK